ncbi:unnamed protein product [Ectocarpus sp. 6 AP-2014]
MAARYSGRSLGTTRANAAVAMFRQALGRAVWAAAGIMILVCCARPALGKEVKGLSFYPPFQSFNARGDRTVSAFNPVGAAAAKQSFVRLTPDAKEHFGSLYSRLSGRFSEGPVGGEFSLAMSFRVSGDEEKTHGKYLAVILGNPDMIRRTGDTYGVPEDFIGVGVVISPRPPSDLSDISGAPIRAPGPRQFVSFIANNGTRTTEDVRMAATSCASTLRYYQGRDDFNFLKMSRIRLGYYDGEISLEVDARNVGVWRKCITTKVTDMPEGWLDRAGVIVAGETSREVSNNHDVMSLEVYTEKSDAFDAKKVDGDVEEDNPEADLAERKKKRMYAFKAHLEHEFDAVRGKPPLGGEGIVVWRDRGLDGILTQEEHRIPATLLRGARRRTGPVCGLGEAIPEAHAIQLPGRHAIAREGRRAGEADRPPGKLFVPSGKRSPTAAARGKKRKAPGGEFFSRREYLLHFAASALA